MKNDLTFWYINYWLLRRQLVGREMLKEKKKKMYLDGQKGYAGPLVTERKVHPLLCDRNGLDLGVYDHFGVCVESALPCCYSTYKTNTSSVSSTALRKILIGFPPPVIRVIFDS